MIVHVGLREARIFTPAGMMCNADRGKFGTESQLAARQGP